MSLTSRLFFFGSAFSYGDEPHWLSLTSGTFEGSGTVDAGNNLYSTRADSGFGGATVSLTKTDVNGDFVYSKLYGETARQTEPIRNNALVIDDSGNIYFLAEDSTSAGNTKSLFIKTNSSGQLQFTREVSSSPGNGIEFTGIAKDSSDNMYISAIALEYVPSSGSFDQDAGVLLKYNSSGALQWQKFLYRDVLASYNYNTQFNAIAVDNDDNIIVVGKFDYGELNDSGECLIVKYDSTGTVLWQKFLGDYQGDDKSQVFLDVRVDSSNNIICTGSRSDVLNDAYCLLVKFNSSGSILFQKRIGTLADSPFLEYCAVDQFDDIFVAFHETSNTGTLVHKFSGVDGSLIFARELDKSGDAQYLTAGIVLDNSSNVILSGFATDTNPAIRAWIAKLSPEGTGTGTIGSGWVYSTYSQTVTTENLTLNTGILDEFSGTATETGVTLQESTNTLTYTTYDIT
tara:strand:+ start:3737 stop:5107 length:1371 start_codon:yes stop_codon:yes gene_type:complete